MLQTIGGFLTTGSGGGLTRHSIFEQLAGLKFVSGRGELWRNDSDTTAFYALGVNLGLSGVTYESVLRMTTRGIYSIFFPLDQAADASAGDLLE